jgi:hypothetical protein
MNVICSSGTLEDALSNDLRQRRNLTPIVEAAHKFLVLSAMAILRQQRLFEPSSVLGFRFLLV